MNRQVKGCKQLALGAFAKGLCAKSYCLAHPSVQRIAICDDPLSQGIILQVMGSSHIVERVDHHQTHQIAVSPVRRQSCGGNDPATRKSHIALDQDRLRSRKIDLVAQLVIVAGDLLNVFACRHQAPDLIREEGSYRSIFYGFC
ncbi:hypothetical protein TPR58_20710 [Sphingomonas sp. HF-S3]|uniref:Uncharacterized protein n=1 Tax=Sphingomonas rustica TaxID=3103142 RepID=A0ABV0BGW4_9SPHN